MVDPKTNVSPLRKPVPCPNCGQTSHRETYPFCSNRCSEVDLNRWFSGSYGIAVKDDGEADGDEWSES